MDFPTRNLYRSAIEELARGSDLTETRDRRARASWRRPACSDRRRSTTSADARSRLSPDRRRARRPSKQAIGFRAAAARLRSAASAAARHRRLCRRASPSSPRPLLACRCSAAGASAASAAGWLVLARPARAVCRRSMSRWRWSTASSRASFGATLLPGLALRDGVPAASAHAGRGADAADDAPSDRRSRSSGWRSTISPSPDGDLHFALLSDWIDARRETVAGDDDASRRGRRRHRAAQPPLWRRRPDGDRFLLLHRRRVWNEGEGTWMGWERKRGKLHELNRLLRGATDTTFIAIDGQSPAVPADVRYVITLDADTRLPRDAARRLVGKMAHPLNRPRFDAATGRVVEGYGVLQPRVTPSLPIGREGSLFQRIFSSTSGIDPYAAAVSDVYQDLFGEGSYAGKGIYDVDAFEAALRRPRAGQHAAQPRSVRGHLRARRPGLRHRGGRGISRPLRRRRRAPASLGARRLAVAALDLRPRTRAGSDRRGADAADRPLEDARQSAAHAVGAGRRRSRCWPAGLLPLAAALGLDRLRPARRSRCRRCCRSFAAIVPRRAGHHAAQPSARARRRSAAGAARRPRLLVDLPGASGLADGRCDRADAVPAVRHAAGICWSGSRRRRRAIGPRLDLRRLLSPDGRRRRHRRRWRRSSSGAVGGAALAARRCRSSLLWLVVAGDRALGQPVAARRRPAGGLDADAQALRLIARRTWRFFETFVTPADNMLPPDNFQEDPQPVVAHRTSPTNIGLYLLSAVARPRLRLGRHRSRRSSGWRRRWPR